MCYSKNIAGYAWLQEGVIGSRMTGAGFGGCTISIVQKAQVDRFVEKVRNTYYEKTSLEAEFYGASLK